MNEDEHGLEALVSPTEDVASRPDSTGHPIDLVRKMIPEDILERYEVYSYRNAAVILRETRPAEFDEVLDALRSFSITPDLIAAPAATSRRFQSSCRRACGPRVGTKPWCRATCW